MKTLIIVALLYSTSSFALTYSDCKAHQAEVIELAQARDAGVSMKKAKQLNKQSDAIDSRKQLTSRMIDYVYDDKRSPVINGAEMYNECHKNMMGR